MADLNLTNQTALAGQVKTRTDQLRTELEKRKGVWDRMPAEKKRAWVKSGKDPVMGLAWELFKYLKNNFFEGEDTNG